METATLTMSDIRRIDIDNGGHFFDRDTMLHFGDTMRTLRLIRLYGRIFVAAKSGAVYEFLPETGRMHPRAETLDELRAISEA